MGVSERKQREKVYRETSILEAAKKVFLAKGLLAATIDDIAADAELSKGTLYRYYRSKEEIMLAISEQATSELYVLFNKAAAGDDSGLEKVLRMIRAYYSFVLANPAYFGFIAFFESPLPVTNAGVVYETTNAIYGLFQTVYATGHERRVDAHRPQGGADGQYPVGFYLRDDAVHCQQGYASGRAAESGCERAV